MRKHYHLYLLFLSSVFFSCSSKTGNTSQSTDTVSVLPIHWVDTLDKINDNPDCVRRISEQLDYLNAEHLADSFTYDKFLVSDSLVTQPKGLNISSLRSAAEFKTKLSEELENKGVNFAGHYSLAAVGMTGWGANYWIIDRSNGKAYEFPYKATYISFHKNSNLIILNPKDEIMNAIRSMHEYTENCAYIANGYSQLHTDLRPFYFLWKDNKLQLLGPQNIEPPINTFWKDYFGR